MKKLLILLLFVTYSVFGETVLLNNTSKSYFNGSTDMNGDASADDLQPGDTLLINFVPTVGTFYFNNFHGTLENPIYIELDSVLIDADGANNGVGLENCSNVFILHPRVENTNQEGLKGTSYCWNLHVLYGSFVDIGSIGVRIGFESNSTDSLTWRRHFQEDISEVNYCYFKRIAQEAVYIQNSNGQTMYQGIQNKLYKTAGALIANANYNVIDSCGREGIQAGSIFGLFTCHDNVVTNYAQLNESGHSNGIQAGEATQAIVYNNYVEGVDGTNGSHYQFQGDGLIAWNNIGIGAGAPYFILGSVNSNNRSIGIYHSASINATAKIYINTYGAQRFVNFNNNIVHTATDLTGYVTIEGNGFWDESNNLFTYEAENSVDVIFTDPSTDDYTLEEGSPAIGIGTGMYKVFDNGIKYNADGDRRPLIESPDAGAY